ncbi:MAG: basic amino acid ABC transporter substrate-binding protein [Butyricicoccus sp.]|nr:basic amino acid ABC transporter substrate-binding protein [Clostridiales bacterium]MDY5973219.1 basic amino acid ABC transporter substrate-binding protein [Butyricicoccus sp.]
MKRKLAFLMAASLIATGALAGCGGSKDAAADANQDAAADAQQPAETTGGTLRMGTNATFPPYESVDDNNNVVGIDADIAAAVAEKLGMQLEITNMEFDSLIPALNADQIDIIFAGMTITEERKESVDFSDSYATGIQSIIVPENSDIASPDDLAGKKVGVQTGTTGDIYCTDDLGEECVQRFESGVVATQALVNGQIDAVVIDNEPAKAYVAANEGLKIVETAYAVEDYAAAINKGNTELLDKVNGALKELKDEGKLDEIIKTYIHE